MDTQKTKVFISQRFTGKTFEDLTAERKQLHVLAEQYNLELPEQFLGYQFEEDFKAKDYDPTFVLAKDKKYIKESDIVVADFRDPGFGTCAEVVIAKELYDKKLIGIVPVEKRKTAWRRFYFDHFVSSFEEAFEFIRENYSTYKHPENVDKRQYDSIAVEYQLVEATPLQKYVYDPNAKNLLQEYGKGKKVAVFHCASGHRARMAKEAGASEVLGLDTSFKQISLAREIELSKEDGIKYLVLNAYSKDFAEELPNEYKDGFDVVLGFFLIDHAQTKVELQTLAKNIYGNLKPGGMFIALLDDSEARVPTDPKYGVAIQPLEGRGDGSQRKIVIYQNMKDGEDRPVLHFFNFEWTRDTVQKIFNDVGFTTIFKDPFIVEEGKQNLGSEFWEKYEADPDNVLFICQK